MNIQFRQAAADNNIDLMRQLAKSVNPFEAGPTSLKTAAHRAAEKGHAAVLRFLFNLGDTFDRQDGQGKTPEQLTKSRACINVFQLARLAQEATRMIDKVIPHRVDVESNPDPGFLLLRTAAEIYTNRLVKQRVGAVLGMVKLESMSIPENEKGDILSKWNLCCSHLAYKFMSYTTLLAWKDKADCSGACAETNSVAFAYLNYVKKTSHRVEFVTVPFNEKNNHCFLILNRKEDADMSKGLEEAIAIDVYFRKSFFFEHRDLAQTPFKVSPITLLSTALITPPTAPWPQRQSTALFHQIEATLETNCKELFRQLDIT